MNIIKKHVRLLIILGSIAFIGCGKKDNEQVAPAAPVPVIPPQSVPTPKPTVTPVPPVNTVSGMILRVQNKQFVQAKKAYEKYEFFKQTVDIDKDKCFFKLFTCTSYKSSLVRVDPVIVIRNGVTDAPYSEDEIAEKILSEVLDQGKLMGSPIELDLNQFLVPNIGYFNLTAIPHYQGKAYHIRHLDGSGYVISFDIPLSANPIYTYNSTSRIFLGSFTSFD